MIIFKYFSEIVSTYWVQLLVFCLLSAMVIVANIEGVQEDDGEANNSFCRPGLSENEKSGTR